MREDRIYLTRKQIKKLYEYGTITIKRGKQTIMMGSKFRADMKCRIESLRKRLKTLEREEKRK